MANEQNLIPTNQRSKNEARELGRKGGIASGISRRQKKSCREFLMMFRDMPLTQEKLKAKLKDSGVDDDDMTYGAALGYQTVAKALQGNVQAMRLVYEMLGENDTQGTTTVNNNLPPQINVNFVGGDDDGH